MQKKQWSVSVNYVCVGYSTKELEHLTKNSCRKRMQNLKKKRNSAKPKTATIMLYCNFIYARRCKMNVALANTNLQETEKTKCCSNQRKFYTLLFKKLRHNCYYYSVVYFACLSAHFFLLQRYEIILKSSLLCKLAIGPKIHISQIFECRRQHSMA